MGINSSSSTYHKRGGNSELNPVHRNWFLNSTKNQKNTESSTHKPIIKEGHESYNINEKSSKSRIRCQNIKHDSYIYYPGKKRSTPKSINTIKLKSEILTNSPKYIEEYDVTEHPAFLQGISMKNVYKKESKKEKNYKNLHESVDESNYEVRLVNEKSKRPFYSNSTESNDTQNLYYTHVSSPVSQDQVQQSFKSTIRTNTIPNEKTQFNNKQKTIIRKTKYDPQESPKIYNKQYRDCQAHHGYSENKRKDLYKQYEYNGVADLHVLPRYNKEILNVIEENTEPSIANGLRPIAKVKSYEYPVHNRINYNYKELLRLYHSGLTHTPIEKFCWDTLLKNYTNAIRRRKTAGIGRSKENNEWQRRAVRTRRKLRQGHNKWIPENVTFAGEYPCLKNKINIDKYNSDLLLSYPKSSRDKKYDIDLKGVNIKNKFFGSGPNIFHSQIIKKDLNKSCCSEVRPHLISYNSYLYQNPQDFIRHSSSLSIPQTTFNNEKVGLQNKNISNYGSGLSIESGRNISGNNYLTCNQFKVRHTTPIITRVYKEESLSSDSPNFYGLSSTSLESQSRYSDLKKVSLTTPNSFLNIETKNTNESYIDPITSENDLHCFQESSNISAVSHNTLPTVDFLSGKIINSVSNLSNEDNSTERNYKYSYHDGYLEPGLKPSGVVSSLIKEPQIKSVNSENNLNKNMYIKPNNMCNSFKPNMSNYCLGLNLQELDSKFNISSIPTDFCDDEFIYEESLSSEEYYNQFSNYNKSNSYLCSSKQFIKKIPQKFPVPYLPTPKKS